MGYGHPSRHSGPSQTASTVAKKPSRPRERQSLMEPPTTGSISIRRVITRFVVPSAGLWYRADNSRTCRVLVAQSRNRQTTDSATRQSLVHGSKSTSTTTNELQHRMVLTLPMSKSPAWVPRISAHVLHIVSRFHRV